MAKWIRFQKGPRQEGRLTDTWAIFAIQGGDFLGAVKWYSGWRRYVFAPDPDAIFEQDCLRDIANFLVVATGEQKADAEIRRRARA